MDFDKSASASTAKKLLSSMSNEQKAAIQSQTLSYMNTAKWGFCDKDDYKIRTDLLNQALEHQKEAIRD